MNIYTRPLKKAHTNIHSLLGDCFSVFVLLFSEVIFMKSFVFRSIYQVALGCMGLVTSFWVFRACSFVSVFL